MATNGNHAELSVQGAADANVRGAYGIVLAALAIVLIVPIWMVEYPPLVDYPNHLARGYILYHHDDVATFHEHFDVDYFATPSLATDVFLIAVQPICDVRTAGNFFLTLTLWLWLLGWHLLGCAIHGKPTWFACAGALVAYHSMLLYGFTNFSFGLGLFLLATAVWLPLRTKWAWWRFVLAGVLALGCYFSHLSASIFLVGTAFAITLWDAVRQRKITLAMLGALVPVLLPFALFLTAKRSGEGKIVWATLMQKFVGALCMFRGYNRHIDAAFIVLVAVLVILLGIWASRRSVHGATLFAGLGCVGMFLAAPYEIFGGAPGDARFLPPAAALILLSLDLDYPRKKAIALFGLFVVLVVFRYAMIGAYWGQFDPELREQVEVMQQLPEEARVYSIVNVPDQPDEQKLGLASFHMINYAVIDRHAYVPLLLAFPGQQPMTYKQPPVSFHGAEAPSPSVHDVDWTAIFANWEYLWCWNVPDDYREYLQKRAVLVAEKGRGTLWRVKR